PRGVPVGTRGDSHYGGPPLWRSRELRPSLAADGSDRGGVECQTSSRTTPAPVRPASAATRADVAPGGPPTRLAQRPLDGGPGHRTDPAPLRAALPPRTRAQDPQVSPEPRRREPRGQCRPSGPARAESPSGRGPVWCLTARSFNPQPA